MCSHWTTDVVTDLLCTYWTACRYWTDKKENWAIESIYWAILVYGNHVFPLNCPLCARSVSLPGQIVKIVREQLSQQRVTCLSRYSELIL